MKNLLDVDENLLLGFLDVRRSVEQLADLCQGKNGPVSIGQATSTVQSGIRWKGGHDWANVHHERIVPQLAVVVRNVSRMAETVRLGPVIIGRPKDSRESVPSSTYGGRGRRSAHLGKSFMTHSAQASRYDKYLLSLVIS